MASKNAFVHGTGQHFLFPPDKLVIVGLDTNDVAGSHPLWRADAKDEAPQWLIDSIRKHKVLQPGRARKIDDETAEVVMGRDRTKACRILQAEGLDIKMPMLVWPKGSSIAEIIGAANAENSARKNESLTAQAEGVFAQLQAEGYGDGNEENAIKSVSISTGMSAQRVRNLLAFRCDKALVKAYESGKVKGEVLMSIATLEDEKARADELARVIADPSSATVIEVRERVSYKKATARAEKAASKPAKAPKKASKKPAKKKDDDEHKGPGISKPLAKRIAKSEMDLPADERHVDQLVIKTLKVVAGTAEASSVPGLTAALKSLGL